MTDDEIKKYIDDKINQVISRVIERPINVSNRVPPKFEGVVGEERLVLRGNVPRIYKRLADNWYYCTLHRDEGIE